MAIKGKLIGAILGGLTFGPFGALAGLATGHFLDSNSEATKKAVDNYIKLFCAGVFAVAKFDGNISEAEISEIESIFDPSKMNGEEYRKAVLYLRSMRTISALPSEVAGKFVETFSDVQMRAAFLGGLVRVANANGAMSASLREEMGKTARILGISLGVDNVASTSTALMDAYATLGVSSEATSDEIKKVYRAKCKDLHPDTLRAKGVGEFAIKAIEDELCRINDAYSLIEKHRKQN